MPCPSCGISVDLVHDGHSPSECASPQRDLLKHCPKCGKLFLMGEHVCDQPSCRNEKLDIPHSTWADAHGGVQRRRSIRQELTASVPGTPQIVVFPDILQAEVGDTLISGYGRLYLDTDPNVRCYRDDGARAVLAGAPFEAFPRSEATALLAHSGYVGVLGEEAAFLLDANNPVPQARVEVRATAQMIADDEWWLIGAEGVRRISLLDALNDQPAALLLSGEFDDVLPPIRLENGVVWLVLPTGRHFIFDASDQLCERPALPNGEHYFAAFTSDGFAVLLSNRADNAGGVVRAWTLAGLAAGAEPETRELDFSLLHTWCAQGNTAYVGAASGDTILQLRLEMLQFSNPPLILPPQTGLQEFVWLDESPGLLLYKTRDGKFRLFDPNGSGRDLPWNSEWNGGSVKSWIVWSRNIVAIVHDTLDGAEISRLVTIPRNPAKER